MNNINKNKQSWEGVKMHLIIMMMIIIIIIIEGKRGKEILLKLGNKLTSLLLCKIDALSPTIKKKNVTCDYSS